MSRQVPAWLRYYDAVGDFSTTTPHQQASLSTVADMVLPFIYSSKISRPQPDVVGRTICLYLMT